jgi:hypothetical protein
VFCFIVFEIFWKFSHEAHEGRKGTKEEDKQHFCPFICLSTPSHGAGGILSIHFKVKIFEKKQYLYFTK